MTQATLNIKVDSSEVDKGKKSLDSLAVSGGTAEKSIDGLSSSAKKAAGLIAGYFTFDAVKSGIAGVIRANTEFSASISELSAITGATGKDLEYLSEQSKEIGRTTTLSASQAATAFKLIASAKPDLLQNAQALSEVTKQAVLLSQAAGVGLADAATTVGTSLNQFGASADQAARFVNVLAAGAKFGSSEINESALALKNAGAAANAAGISFETTNAAIQALASGGIKAAEAGTSLRNIILILEQELDDGLKPSVVGLTSAIGNLANKELSLTELTEIFGRENVVAAQTIINQSSALAGLERDMTGTSTAIEQATVIVDNLKGDMLLAKSATEALQISLGEKLDPALRDATKSFAEFAGNLAEFVETDDFDEWLEATGNTVTALSLIVGTKMVIAYSAASIAAADLAKKQAIAAAEQTAAMTVVTQAEIRKAEAALASAMADVNAARAAAARVPGFYLNTQAMAALAAAEASATAATAAHTAATAAHTAAMAASVPAAVSASASITAFKGALALVGGPIGAITLALGGLALAYMQVSDARDRAAKGAQDWILKQDAQTLDLQMYALATQIKNANTQLEALERNSSSGSRRIREQKEEIARLASEMEVYARKRAELTNAENKGAVTTEKLKTEVGKLGAELGIGVKKIDYTTESLLDMSVVMESLRTGHVPGLDRTMQDLNERIEKSRFRMIGVTDASRDMVNVSHETAEQRIRDEEQVAEAAQRQWENTRDYLAETFIDIADNGGSAFEKIGEAAIAVIKRIIAEWLAAKSLMALGINAPFSASMGGFGGGVASGASSAIGGAVAGGGFAAMGNAGSLMNSVLGIGGNSMVAPSTAAGGLMNGIGSFMTSPAGIAIAAALIAGKIIHDKTSDPDNYTRSSAGFLTAPTAGARSGQTFSVSAFASGFKPIGFADKTSQEEARKVIDSYRELDAVLVKAANALGGFVDMSKATLSGVGADGIAGTSGTFMGMGGKSTEADIAAMANSYAKQFVKHIEGISPDVVAKLAGASSATELISVMKQIAESNEFIAKQDSTLSAIYAQMPRELQSALSELSGIKEVNGMLFNSNGDLVDSNRKVIASADVLSLVMESLPLDMQNAITKSMMDAERKKAEDAAKLSAGAFSAVFGSSSGGASADVASLRVREHVASLAEIRELEGNLAAMGLSHIAATPAGIDLDSSRSMLSIYNSGDISAANSFAIANPDIAKSVGYKSTPTSEIQTMKEEMQNMVISLQSIVVSSNMTARAITEAVKQGEGSLSVVVA